MNGGAGPPSLKGLALTGLLTVVGLIFTRYLGTPVGMEFLKLVGAAALLAGAVIGWIVRERVRKLTLARSAGIALAVFVVATIAYFVVPDLVGAGFLGASLLSVAVALLFLSFGALASFAGIKLSNGGADESP